LWEQFVSQGSLTGIVEFFTDSRPSDIELTESVAAICTPEKERGRDNYYS